MIIQIRGTSGSGKSTVMRQIIDGLAPLPQWEAQHIEGRLKPETYRLGSPLSGRDHAIYVLGHYESPCGGCDTIGSAKAVYELIQKLNQFGGNRVILCEGLLLSEDVKWSSQLSDLRAIFLTTPIEVCLKQIEQRRKDGGNDKPLNPANTVNRVKTIERARVKLVEAGVSCYRMPCGQAVETVLRWLRG